MLQKFLNTKKGPNKRKKRSEIKKSFQETITICSRINIKWPVPSKLQENPLEAKPPENNLPPRLRASLRPQRVESRSPIATDLAPWRSERSESTRSLPSFSFASSLFRDSFVKLPRTSSLISDFSPLPSLLFRRYVLWSSFYRVHVLTFVSLFRLLRRTLLVCSKTPTFVLSMPSVSPSCPRISSWPVASVEREPKYLSYLSL